MATTVLSYESELHNFFSIDLAFLHTYLDLMHLDFEMSLIESVASTAYILFF